MYKKTIKGDEQSIPDPAGLRGDSRLWIVDGMGFTLDSRHVAWTQIQVTGRRNLDTFQVPCQIWVEVPFSHWEISMQKFGDENLGGGHLGGSVG